MARDVEQLIDRARAQINHGNLAGAIESLRQALSIDPDHSGAHALLALCLHDERRLHAAEHEARLAVGLDPDSGLAHYAAAMVALAQRDFARAEEHLRRAIALMPEHTHSLLGLARLYQLWNRPQDALPFLEKARELAPDDADTWAALGDFYKSQRDFERAGQYAHEGLKLNPENTEALLVMGEVLLQRGDTAGAREHALLVLRQNANHEGAVHLLTAAKARESPLLGLWWRFNAFFGGGSIMRRVVMLLGIYLAYRVGVLVAGDLGHPNLQGVLAITWIGFCIYTWVGPALFQKQIKRELEPATLHSKY
jgi:tetratricopeptide (TPR) repeat protein